MEIGPDKQKAQKILVNDENEISNLDEVSGYSVNYLAQLDNHCEK